MKKAAPSPKAKRPGAIQGVSLQGVSLFKPCLKCKGVVVFVDGEQELYLWCPSCDVKLPLPRGRWRGMPSVR